jgi:hypothetical protein
VANFLADLTLPLPNLPMEALMTNSRIQTIEDLGALAVALKFEGNLSSYRFKLFHEIGHVDENKR